MTSFIMIRKARVSFPHLFTRPVINGEQGKYGATLVLDPKENETALNAIQKEITNLIKEKFKSRKLAPEKICLRNGDDKSRAEYEGYQVLSANSRDKPIIISNTGNEVLQDEEECAIYPGCFVNAKIRLWPQDNNFGKRINAELVAIQFAGEGEALDKGGVNLKEIMEGFDEIEEEKAIFASSEITG